MHFTLCCLTHQQLNFVTYNMLLVKRTSENPNRPPIEVNRRKNFSGNKLQACMVIKCIKKILKKISTTNLQQICVSL